MKCPVCGTVNAPGETFCSNCGAYLDPSASSAGQTIVSSITPAPATASNTNTNTNPGSSTLTGSGGRTASSLAPGATLQNGRYAVQKILGQGGMGAALLAKDTRVSNKLVVVKELVSDNTDPAKRQEDIRNFEREVETLATIDHPLVPKVTDSFQEGSHYFMVQEYVAGENLEDRMERVNQPMPEREALSYASQLLDVLDYLSQQTPPIVHRDIKPANIIIDAKKRAHLVDFGIARADVAKNAKRKQTSALGTPGYAPPEQYQGNADARSDLYALAATLHHVLTNRDPRNYAPFAYPAVRTLNHQLSPDIERVLNRALLIDITKRYQTAAAMKADIDHILMSRFQSSGDMTGAYTYSAPSTPLPPAPATPPPPPAGQPKPTPAPQAAPARSVYPPPSPTPIPPQRRASPQVGAYVAPPPRRQQGGFNWVTGSFILLVLVILLIAGFIFLPGLLRSKTASTGSPGSSQATVTTTNLPANGIGVTQINGEPIGISDGSVVLDTTLPDASLKQQAANDFQQGNTAGAVALWNSAVAQTSNDAEALIYLENAHIANYPYITIVVATMLSGNDSAAIGVGESDLQGAYVAQKEFNDNSKLNNGMKVRLLIANAGGSSPDSQNAARVAQQIVQLAKADKTFVGVMGWPYSAYSINAISVLNNAHIPMVAQTASSDLLSGTSPYFFRVNPSNQSEAKADVQYAEQTLHAKKVALFYDQGNAYTQTLAQDFQNQFTADGNQIVATEKYTVGNASTLSGTLQDALSKNPDLIYFAGYSTDMSTLLSDMMSAHAPANLQILGGDALYELSGYPASVRPELPHLHFSAFFYPDEWDVLGLTNSTKKPPFFTEYPADFNPNNQQHSTPYGYTRPTNDAALSYDATLALLTAYNNVAKSGATVTPQAMQSGLQQINSTHPLQGVSGQIAFDNNGNPINKAIVILYFDSNNFIHMDTTIEGTFLTP
jgi:serine/threonine protein kinase/ABC-type branched-subunit amino acid transport system substrate-binding protein